MNLLTPAKRLLILFLIIFSFSTNVISQTNIELIRLKDGYPELIQSVSSTAITWKDGSQFQVSEPSRLYALMNWIKADSHSKDTITIKDLQCDHYENIFKKMYGHNATEVKKKLVVIYWMQKAFGHKYPLKVTTVNGIDKKIQRISAALENLPQSYWKFVENPGGSFYWRNVKREPYLSAHSFGIAIDINSHYGRYWLWDLQKLKSQFSFLAPVNNIPMKIVQIFEQEGFLWGGRWHFYDTMHFEYRPELFSKESGSQTQYNGQLGLHCVA